MPDVAGFCDALASWLSSFDAEVWTAAEAKRAVELFARLTRVSGAALAVAAGRVDRTTAWSNTGDRSAAAYLARVTGTTAGHAGDTLRAVRQLDQLAATSDAFRNGELSLGQASAIANAAAADPNSEARLLEAAQSAPLGELQRRSREVVVHADRSDDPRERRHAKRQFRAFPGEDGMRAYAGELPPDVAGEVEAVWNAFTSQAFRAARAEGRREPERAYMADGLLAMARAAAEYRKNSTAGAPAIRPHFVFRIDVAPMLRGRVRPGEVCEIPGVGPVDVQTARHHLPRAMLDFVVHEGIDVRTVAHAKRKATRTQLAALLSREYVCEVEGCGCREHLEIDHIRPYAHTGTTTVAELGYKSRHHHDLKSYRGWTDGPLQPNGRRTLIPPRAPPPRDP